MESTMQLKEPKEKCDKKNKGSEDKKSVDFSEEDIINFIDNKLQPKEGHKKLLIKTVIPKKNYRLNFYEYKEVEDCVLRVPALYKSQFIEIVIKDSKICIEDRTISSPLDEIRTFS